MPVDASISEAAHDVVKELRSEQEQQRHDDDDVELLDDAPESLDATAVVAHPDPENLLGPCEGAIVRRFDENTLAQLEAEQVAEAMEHAMYMQVIQQCEECDVDVADGLGGESSSEIQDLGLDDLKRILTQMGIRVACDCRRNQGVLCPRQPPRTICMSGGFCVSCSRWNRAWNILGRLGYR